jgi:hypothetical protein
MKSIKHESAIIQVQKKALICSDFDGDCFGLNGNSCSEAYEQKIGGVTYITPEADGVCPMARG